MSSHAYINIDFRLLLRSSSILIYFRAARELQTFQLHFNGHFQGFFEEPYTLTTNSSFSVRSEGIEPQNYLEIKMNSLQITNNIYKKLLCLYDKFY